MGVTRLSRDDLDAVARGFALIKGGGVRRCGGRGGFSQAIIKGAAHRCAHGCPQVLLCSAEKDAKPFPTTFWLICPHLTRLVSRLESQNGVAGLEESLAGREEQWGEYHRAHALLRLSMISRVRRKFLRLHRPGIYGVLRRGGVGGILYGAGARNPKGSSRVTAKCLHLQLASYLGFGAHPASDWLEKHISSWECGENLCSAWREF
jgi:hypothetical protein